MKDIATLAISPNTLCRLLQYADAHPSGPCAGDLAALAIEEWLARADAHRRDLATCRAPHEACTPMPGSPPSPRFSTVLPSENTTANPQARTSRLPRVAPIPTQARHQQVTRALAEADRTMLNASNRRQGSRRREDLLLD